MRVAIRLLASSILWVGVGCSSPGASPPSPFARVGLEARSYNSEAMQPDVAALVRGIQTKYRGRSVVNRYTTGSQDPGRGGLREREHWRFRTIRPVGRGDGGAYYYRFTFTVKRYRDPASAARAMNSTLAAFRRQRSLDGKGDVSYRLLVQDRIYTLATDCLMNRILDRYYRRLLTHVLGKAPPEKRSVLRHHCGGGYTWK